VTSLDALVPYPLVVHPHGLLVSTLGLGFTVTSSHFLNGSMKVRCVARVSPILWRGDSESVVQRVWPEIEKNTREALILRKSQYDVSTLNCPRTSNLPTAYHGPTDFPESLQHNLSVMAALLHSYALMNCSTALSFVVIILLKCTAIC